LHTIHHNANASFWCAKELMLDSFSFGCQIFQLLLGQGNVASILLTKLELLISLNWSTGTEIGKKNCMLFTGD